MRRYRLSLILLLALFALLPVLSSFAQTGTPPAATETPLPQTATPVSLCPPEWEKTCEYVKAWGLPGLLLAALIAVIVWLWARFAKVAEKKTEDSLQKGIEEIEAAGAVSEATTRYLKWFIEEYRYVKFRGKTRSRGIEPPELSSVYVSLRMQMGADESERARSAIKGMRQKESSEQPEAMLRLADKPVNLPQAFEKSRKVAVIGVAGSGKSTLLQWAGLACARARVAPTDLNDEQKALLAIVEKGQPPIPVLIPLREFNRYCKDYKLDHTAASLLSFIPIHIAKENPSLKLPDGFFETHLRSGGEGCLLMLDGVDEIAMEDRLVVRAAIEGFLSGVCGGNPRNRYLITSRVEAYLGNAEVANFQDCLVQPLTPDERDHLIRSWYASVYHGAKAKTRADDLCRSIGNSHEEVRALAVTPLMVTIFALVHYEDATLPQQRAELYSRAVNTLLTEEEFKEGEAVKDLAKRSGYEPTKSRKLLARIAYEMHALPEQRGDTIKENDLVDHIWNAFAGDEETARDEARRFIRVIADRGGLLERRDDRYDFYTHRTFREFLAGAHLAKELESQWPTLLANYVGDDRWREPILLAAGFLVLDSDEKTNKFIGELASLKGVDADGRAKALTLAGLAVADLIRGDDKRADPALLETKKDVVADMKAALIANPPVVEPPLRRPLGLALAALGDPRFAQPLWERKPAEVSGKEGYFIPIPSGPFRMGTSADEAERLKAQKAESWADEKPQHEVEVAAFAIGRYPVTNADYRRFMEDGGYTNPAYWPGEAALWLNGQMDLEKHVALYSKDYQDSYRDWLKNRPPEKRKQPYFWDDPQRNADTLPVVGVTWYEAQAYCLWLAAKLRAARLIAPDQHVHLPTEAQWEKAARAPISNVQSPLWPWGDEWDADKCNSEESKFGGPTPVGMYPHGASGRGVQDMVGNVWEWTSTVWGTKGETPDFAYPYRSDDGREDPDAVALRVVRGGSWDFYRYRCRAAVRVGYVPAGFSFASVSAPRSPHCALEFLKF